MQTEMHSVSMSSADITTHDLTARSLIRMNPIIKASMLLDMEVNPVQAGMKLTTPFPMNGMRFGVPAAC